VWRGLESICCMWMMRGWRRRFGRRDLWGLGGIYTFIDRRAWVGGGWVVEVVDLDCLFRCGYDYEYN